MLEFTFIDFKLLLDIPHFNMDMHFGQVITSNFNQVCQKVKETIWWGIADRGPSISADISESSLRQFGKKQIQNGCSVGGYNCISDNILVCIYIYNCRNVCILIIYIKLNIK